MKKSNVLVAAAFLIIGFSGAGLAQEPATPTFEQIKAKIITKLDERIKLLQDEKTCVQAATTKEDIKKCHAPVAAQREEAMKRRAAARQGAAAPPEPAQ